MRLRIVDKCPAWFELLNGAEIHITTTKEFNSKYLFKQKKDEI